MSQEKPPEKGYEVPQDLPQQSAEIADALLVEAMLKAQFEPALALCALSLALARAIGYGKFNFGEVIRLLYYQSEAARTTRARAEAVAATEGAGATPAEVPQDLTQWLKGQKN